MATTTRSTVESLEDKGSSQETSKSFTKGPPPASPRPRSAADSSLYSTVGKAGVEKDVTGLGAEGNNPALVGMQGLALVQRGIQMLNLAFPENPGLVAVLADLTGRLQTLIPQMANQTANGMGGGMMGMMMQQQPGMAGAPMGGLPPAPPGAGMGGPQPPGGAPMPPPVPPVPVR